jgi:hypothetical protein
MSGQVQIAADVVDALGHPDIVESMRREAAGDDFICVSCSLQGSTEDGDTASVILFRHPDGDVAKIAHATCLQSRVIPIDGPVRDSRPRSPDNDMSDVVTLAAVLDSDRGPIAGLVVELETTSSAITPTGDVMHSVVSGLLAQHWSLQTRLTNRPAKAPGWRLFLNPVTSEGRIIQPDGTIFLDQMPDLPAAWLQLAKRRGEVTLLTGHRLGIARAHKKSRHTEALHDAAAAGNLVAARIAIAPLPVSRKLPISRERKAQLSLASALEDAMKQRARPGTTSTHLNAMPDLVELPGRPTLTQIFVSDRALMIVDLAAPTSRTNQADAVMASLREAGFGPLMAWDQGPLSPPPDGWGYLLWPSQILIGAGTGHDGESMKFLFETFAPAAGWYDSVRQSPTNSLGLLVGNLNLNWDDTDQIATRFNTAMATGSVLGIGLTGMCAS